MENAIRERAYHLWIEGGRQDGQADNYWLAAQREVLGTSLGEIGRLIARKAVEAPAKPKKARAPRKKRAA
ncbi:DUF2934 domain-containing protein [Bradyrhizobium erythrophlei]